MQDEEDDYCSRCPYAEQRVEPVNGRIYYVCAAENEDEAEQGECSKPA